jgi:hypothetical protein
MKPSDALKDGSSGSLSDTDLLDVVHTICTASRDGLLEVHSEAGTGRIALRSGRVCHAQIGDLQGETAFSKIASATSGDFHVLPPEKEEEASITKPLEDLLVETVRLQEESRQEKKGMETPEPETEALLQMIQKMTMIQKLRFAMRCNKEGRSLLIRDPNRAVQLAIVSNPRITDSEVAIIAWSKTSDEEVLRRISENREWIRHYQVRLGLARNPKSPMPIATRLLPTLKPEDLLQIAKSKEVPALIAQSARRQILQKK